MAGRVAALLGVLLGLSLPGPSTAAAASAPCVAGIASGTCRAWTGTVTFVADGDTFDADLSGDGTRASRRIRVTGIDAMELRRYSRDPRQRRGACHAVPATARLERLIRAGGSRVRLTARRAASRTGGRLRRSAAVRIDGRWRDLGLALVSEGHALWLPNGDEWAPNLAYSRAAAGARAAGLRLWDPAACASGPAQTAAGLTLRVNADADGTDTRNVNGEWVRIRNDDPSATVPLGGWWLRDSFHRRYRFPPSARIAPLETIIVRAGRGTSAGSTFHWGLTAPAFENPTADARAIGDGAYLFDPHGDLRASMLYPCRVACGDPTGGTIGVRAQFRGEEHVVLRNSGAAPVALDAFQLRSPPYAYDFPPGAVLAAGEELRVMAGGSAERDRAGVRHWGKPHRILDDAGDVVSLSTYDGIVAACTAWGTGRC